MASVRVRWRPEEVSFTVDDAATEASVWTILVHAPGCTLTVMTDEWQESPDGTRITLPGVHIQGAARNAIGVANLRTIGERLCEEINCDELVVEGAIRTTGANPGRTPDHLRFQRRRPASSA